MEEFVTEIQSNIGIANDAKKRTSRFRDLFSKMIVSSPDIRIVNKCDAEGDIVFDVPMKSVGVTFDVLTYYKTEIQSDFAANFLGELLVRENIGKFTKIMMDLKDNYPETVNKYVHRRFGMSIHKDRFVLTFNINLIQTILTESFSKTMA